MPSDPPDQHPRTAERRFDVTRSREEAARDTESLRARMEELIDRDFAHHRASLEAGDQGDDQAQQSMFRDIDAILARVESGIADERAAMNALLDRLSHAA
jgi:hypothetical protein